MIIFRYLAVGGVAAAVDIALFFVFAKQLGLNYFLIGALSFLIATLVNYVLSIRYVFETGIRFGKRQEILLVYMVSLIGLLLHQGLLYLCIDVIKTEMMFGKLAATASVFFWNYLSRLRFIFHGSR